MRRLEVQRGDAWIEVFGGWTGQVQIGERVRISEPDGTLVREGRVVKEPRRCSSVPPFSPDSDGENEIVELDTDSEEISS